MIHYLQILKDPTQLSTQSKPPNHIKSPKAVDPTNKNQNTSTQTTHTKPKEQNTRNTRARCSIPTNRGARYGQGSSTFQEYVRWLVIGFVCPFASSQCQDQRSSRRREGRKGAKEREEKRKRRVEKKEINGRTQHKKAKT